MNAPQRHPDDVFHVILDALSEHLDQIDRGEIHPWLAYVADIGDDVKADERGYLKTLEAARHFAETALNRSYTEQAMLAGRTGGL